MNKQITTLALLASVSAVAACSKKAPDILPPVATDTGTQGTQGTTTGGTTDTTPQPGSQRHFEAALAAIGGSTTIYFGTDRFNIDSSDAAALQAQAQYFARYPQLTFTVEGHADERGTREYNIALGERRANSAKNYLVSLGVSSNRIRTVSHGKEKPVAVGSNEQAWAQNRRAASVMINP